MRNSTLVVATWLTGAFLTAAAQCQEVLLKLDNITPFARKQVIRGSVPFAPGQVFDPTDFSVADKPTAWRVLQKWPDGSVKIGQAQFEDVLAPYEKSDRRVTATKNSFGGFTVHPWILQGVHNLRIVTHVRDIDDFDYFAEPGPWELVVATDAELTVKSRSYHYGLTPGGIGRDFLTQTLYLTVFRDSPILYLDVVIGNDYLGADNPSSNDPNLYPLADIALNAAWLHVEGAHVAFRHEKENEITQYFGLLPGVTSSKLLESTYLADAQAKRWRAVLMFDDLTAPIGERLPYFSTLAAEKDWPIIPLADLPSWQRTGAWGVHGGPVNPPADWQRRVNVDWGIWRDPRLYGPMGGWGDSLETYVSGTPRNGPASESGTKAVQTGSLLPALQLEALAWQQTLRPYHLWGVKVEPTTDIFLYYGLPHSFTGGKRVSTETLGRLALSQHDPYLRWRAGVPFHKAHGWNGYDLEHWSTDFLFDYHALTGDHRTLDELRNLGECLMGALRQTYYYSANYILAARSEGWAMQSFAQMYLATDDVRFKNAAIARARDLIEVKRNKNHPSRAFVFQDNQDKSPYPPPNQYYMPWQHGAVVFGYYAAHKYFEHPVFLPIVHDVVPAVIHAWVANFQDPRFGFVQNGLRYVCPVEYLGQPIPPDYFDRTPNIGVIWGDSPLGGAHTLLINGMDLIYESTSDPLIQQRARIIRSIIHGPEAFTTDTWRWNRWMSLREPK